jgi:cell division protein FtsA
MNDTNIRADARADVAPTVTVGLDIGSSTVKCVVLGGHSRIMGVGIHESFGVTRGIVMNPEEASASIRSACIQAGIESNTEITHLYLALGGEGLAEHRATAEVDIDGSVNDEDIAHVHAEAMKQCVHELQNRTVLHDIACIYWVDGVRALGSPLSLTGRRFGVSMLYISIHTAHLASAHEAVRLAGYEVAETVCASIAASLVTLSTVQKSAGCMLLLAGRDTTIATIFENNTPASLRVFPIGSNTVTEDIALALSCSLDEAERLKRHSGSELMKEKKKVLATIQKRHRGFASDLRLFLDSKRRILPGGIILTGGASHLASLEEHLREFVRLPTARATLPKHFGLNRRHYDASLTPALGAALYGHYIEKEHAASHSHLWRYLKTLLKRMGNFLMSLLP